MKERVAATPVEALIDPFEVDAAAEARAQKFRPRHADLMAAYQKWLARHSNGIADDEVQAKTATLVRQMATLITRVEEDRDALAQPLSQAIEFIKDQYRPFSQSLEGPIKRMREALASYGIQRGVAEQQKRSAAAKRTAERAAAAAERAAETGDDLDIIGMLRADMHAQAAQDRAGASISELSRVTSDYGASAAVHARWKWEVEDLAQVPREWLMIDASKVSAEFRARMVDGKATMQIPGIRVFQDATLTVRG